MSDTDTRSVAEIIGWEFRRMLISAPGEEQQFSEWWSPAGGDGWNHGNPTPDDMLAWLRGQGFDLHAALEAAVRAVDNERAT